MKAERDQRSGPVTLEEISERVDRVEVASRLLTMATQSWAKESEENQKRLRDIERRLAALESPTTRGFVPYTEPQEPQQRP